jgi:hypothetical protein
MRMHHKRVPPQGPTQHKQSSTRVNTNSHLRPLQPHAEPVAISDQSDQKSSEAACTILTGRLADWSDWGIGRFDQNWKFFEFYNLKYNNFAISIRELHNARIKIGIIVQTHAADCAAGRRNPPRDVNFMMQNEGRSGF